MQIETFQNAMHGIWVHLPLRYIKLRQPPVQVSLCFVISFCLACSSTLREGQRSCKSCPLYSSSHLNKRRKAKKKNQPRKEAIWATISGGSLDNSLFDFGWNAAAVKRE